jgi:predicted HicB family RNase H-like nuclease
MKRINIFMEEELHSKIKVISALKKESMNDYIAKALDNLLKKDKTLFEKLK